MGVGVWTVEPEQIWKKPRRPGISGFMRLKNEAEFLDRAIASHIDGLDELAIVYNDCTDETPEICARWAHGHPDKITVSEYEPKVVPAGTQESLAIDPRSPHCIANYYNFALAQTNCRIVIKIDGDHLAIRRRFIKTCNRVRRNLPPEQRYPIYGLNITEDQGEIVIYNYYDYAPQFTGSGGRSVRKGPPPFTGGDHAFYHVDRTSWHIVDPVEGWELMDLSGKPGFAAASLTYCFFHLKGLKADHGTGNWGWTGGEQGHAWVGFITNLLETNPANLATIEAMRRHNPFYFRGANVYKELREAFPDLPVRMPRGEPMPALGLRERLADLWYRVAYP